MLRIVLLSFSAVLYATAAQAHSVHAGCASGPYHSGNGPHYHPGGYGQAVPCGGGHWYAPRPRGDYYYGESRRRYRQHDDWVGPYYRPYR